MEVSPGEAVIFCGFRGAQKLRKLGNPVPGGFFSRRKPGGNAVLQPEPGGDFGNAAVIFENELFVVFGGGADVGFSRSLEAGSPPDSRRKVPCLSNLRADFPRREPWCGAPC